MINKFEFRYPEDYKTSSFFDFYGFFEKYESGYLYCFSSVLKVNTVVVDRFNFAGQRINHVELSVNDCLPPSMWIHDVDSNYVIVSDESIIDLYSLTVIRSNVSFHDKIKSQLYSLSLEKYEIGNYIIKNPSPTIYECYDRCTGSFLWKQHLTGYLYHAIILNNNTFIICTAEHGGGIYLIDALSGTLKNVICTKGTRELCIVDDMIYTYILGEKGAIISASLDSGQIVEKKELYRVTLDCPLLVQDGEAIALSFLCKRTRSIKEYIPILSAFKL